METWRLVSITDWGRFPRVERQEMGNGEGKPYRLVLLGAALGVALGFLPQGIRASKCRMQYGITAGGTKSQELRANSQEPGAKSQAHARPKPPAVWRGASMADALPAGPAFAPAADGSFEVQTRLYRAVLSAGRGLTYRPLPPPSRLSPLPAGRSGAASPLPPPVEGVARAELRVKLARVVRGENVLYDHAAEPDTDDEMAVPEQAGGLSFWRAPGFEERYLPRGDGVEQSFLLETPPEGWGPLRFTCEVEARGLTALPARASRRGGVTFVDEAGRFAVRYGQVVVRDSGKRGVVVEPELSADGRSVSFAVPGSWLARAEYPVEVDPLVGGDFQVSSENQTGVSAPTISAASGSFLVVWNDYRAGVSSPQLYAAIVSQSGVLSGEFPISSGMGLPLDPRSQRLQVASDGSNWLVVWSDDRANGPGIRGCILSTQGAILGGNDFLIASTPGTVVEDPLVAFNGLDYVVAWQDVPYNAAGGSQVYCTRVTSAGVVATPFALPSDFTPINQALLFLAPQKPSGDALLVYRDNGETPAVTRSVRVTPDGSLRDPGGTVLFKESIAEGGFGRPIGAAFVDSAWHVLSSFDQTEDSSVYLHKLDTNSTITPPGGVFAVMGLGPTGLGVDQYAPVFAGAAEWLFVRNEKINNTVYHLLGKRVTFAGEDKDSVPFQIDGSTQGVLRNAVAAQAGSTFLVAWLDGRLGTTQPADARAVFAALVDSTVAGAVETPLVAAAAASPASGEAPLSVLFDSSASTGNCDTLTWSFGDGTISTEAKPTHTYRNNGTYLAQLQLTKGAYTVFDTVVITVGGGGNTGPGGGTIVGTPTPCSPGVEPRLFISATAFKLDFVTASQDAVRVAGVIDPGQLPESLTGLGASVSLGWQSYAFSLDAAGAYKSDPNTDPVLYFALSPNNGSFVFQATNANLRAALDALGATNENVKPARIVDLPITVTAGKSSATVTVGASYKATQGVSGTGAYGFLRAGEEVTGSFLIAKFSAAEETQAKTGLKVHTFSVKGQVKRAEGGNFNASAIGEFAFMVGNYSVSIPGGQFRCQRGKLKYVGRVGISGLKKFSLDFNSGQFNLQMLKVPAEGQGGSGMPLAKSGTDVVKVDLNLSFQFDLADGTRFSAGRYIYCARKDAAAKAWKLR